MAFELSVVSVGDVLDINDVAQKNTWEKCWPGVKRIRKSKKSVKNVIRNIIYHTLIEMNVLLLKEFGTLGRCIFICICIHSWWCRLAIVRISHVAIVKIRDSTAKDSS